MANKKDPKEKETIETTATENEDIFDVYDNNNSNNSQEENNMNEQTQVQNAQNGNQAQGTKKGINWTGVLKVGGAFAIGFAAGATAMHFYEKHNDCSPAENAFI